MKFRTALCLCAATLAVSACSDPKDANKGNFKSAINDWIEKNPPCITIPRGSVSAPGADSGTFPRYVPTGSAGSGLMATNNERLQASFEALVDAGLMDAKETSIMARVGLFGDQQREIPVNAYDLTSKGQKALADEDKPSAFGPAQSRLCYGVPTVKEIAQFTEPADAMGVKVSQVSYSYHLKKLPDWAKNEKMQNAFPQLARETADSIDGKATVVLTNDGWLHANAAKF